MRAACLMLAVCLHAIAQGASGGSLEAAREVLDPFARFAATPPRLAGEDPQAEQALSSACMWLDRRCLTFLSKQPEVAGRALPDNPVFWSRYRSVLESNPLAMHVEDLEREGYQQVMVAAVAWPRHQLLTRGALDVRDLHLHLKAHRRLLAESKYLIDKMVFLATLGITVQAVNVLMAGGAPTATERQLLDEMLEPLTKGELSLRRVLRGELEYMDRRIGELLEPERPEALTLREVERQYAFVAERSEADWADFWRNGIDVLTGTRHPPEYFAGTFADYATNLRYVGVTLEVLRALRSFYEGRVTPGIPATAPPAYWYWQWRPRSQELCLEPAADMHPTLGDIQIICMPYLASDPD